MPEERGAKMYLQDILEAMEDILHWDLDDLGTIVR